MTSLEEPVDIQSATAINTETPSAFIASTAPTRKVVGFVRSEPGYRISVIINAFLLVNGILFGLLAFLTATTDAKEHVQGPDQYEVYDVIGTSLFCLWNSIVWSLILIFPSLTTTKREKNLVFFYLNGCSIFLVKLSDFFLNITRFEFITSLIGKIFSYLLFMAIFCTLYALPEEFHEITRMTSLKPWVPVYEDEDIARTEEQPAVASSV